MSFHSQWNEVSIFTQVIHRDLQQLAAKNILVGVNYTIKTILE